MSILLSFNNVIINSFHILPLTFTKLQNRQGDNYELSICHFVGSKLWHVRILIRIRIRILTPIHINSSFFPSRLAPINHRSSDFRPKPMEEKLARCTYPDEEKAMLLCEDSKMPELHRDVMVKQQTHSEIPQKSTQQPSKPEVVTTVVLLVLETRVIDVLPLLGFVFLTYNVVDALFKAERDYKTISFVVFSYLNLIALFCCVKSLERSPPQLGESPKRRRLKVAMWSCATSLCLPFCTLLNLSFSYRVTSILDSVVTSSFVWTLAVASTVGAFYELFLVSHGE